MDRATFLIALRVITQVTNDVAVSEDDVRQLKRYALPHEADLPIDLLACELIKRYLPEPEQPPPPRRRS
jgi:hypothetical protein